MGEACNANAGAAMLSLAALLAWAGSTPAETGPAGLIEITSLSAYGEYGGDANLLGVRVHNLDDPAQYQVAAYIEGDHRCWYRKAIAPVQPDGTWLNQILNNPESDPTALSCAAILLPAALDPGQAPLCWPGCCATIPYIPEALDMAVADRPGRPAQYDRTVAFAGYYWTAKNRTSRAGPGYNLWTTDAEDLWVDGAGLHLTLAEKSPGIWWCTEVCLEQSFGYGLYAFETHGRIDLVDPYAVFGLFLYDYADADEIDIELTKWRNPENTTNAQFVVHPCGACPGCGDQCVRFDVASGGLSEYHTHFIWWQPGRVEERTYRGRQIGQPPDPASLVKQWVYDGAHVPASGTEQVHLNFWLTGGDAQTQTPPPPPLYDPPQGAERHEVVVSRFHWQAQAPEWGAGTPDNAVWVDFDHTGTETGAQESPFNTLAEGVAVAPPGGLVKICAGASNETITITKSLDLEAHNGAAIIGRAP